MSLVGPRPEQPEFVDRLEKTLPFYQRRHLIRPGITGWAQVRCGYAGSDVGSAWKLCHDLYYMKYRSLRFDLAILALTLWGLLFNTTCTMQPDPMAFMKVTVPAASDHASFSPAPVGGAAPAMSAAPTASSQP
jgi:hypothetical protein